MTIAVDTVMDDIDHAMNVTCFSGVVYALVSFDTFTQIPKKNACILGQKIQ